MNRQHILDLCPEARMIGAASLPDHRFRINAKGWATVVPEMGSRVYGTLWRVGETCLESLDRFEGVPEGLYSRERTEVEAPTGRTTAEIYVASDVRVGKPAESYISEIVQAGVLNDFPAAYLRELESWR